jgi:hypothetical protein
VQRGRYGENLRTTPLFPETNGEVSSKAAHDAQQLRDSP